VLFVSTILVYVAVLLGVAIWKSRATKTHDDFVVAGRSVPVPLLVGTLVCTWIGSGSLFGGAGLAYRTGIAELWFSFGAWVGLLAAYFLAGRVRRIAQYTVPDLLEQRYNAAARVLGTLAIILAYVTIAAYQFRGGGWILSIVTDGRISPAAGMYLTAATIVAFTAFAGMVSIVTVDIFNGVLITIGVLVALPYTVWQLGGIGAVAASLPPTYLQPLGGHNALWAAGVALPTFLLLLGESGMYQKFFSARDEKAARRAVIGMIAGVVTIETALALVAIVGRAAYPDLLERTSVVGRAASETIVLYTARHGLPTALGALLLAAAVAIVLSTGNTFLLVPSTNLSRDLFQRFLRPEASERSKLLVQRAGIVAFGLLGLLLLAAFLWKRVTPQGGVACIAGGLVTIVGLLVLDRAGVSFVLSIAGNRFDFASSDYIVIPGVIVSVGLMIVVSLLTKPSPPEKWKPFME